MTYDKRHGGPYDRGGADAYYGRAFEPHYYFYSPEYKLGLRMEEADMTAADLEAYKAGFEDTIELGHFKDWGR